MVIVNTEQLILMFMLLFEVFATFNQVYVHTASRAHGSGCRGSHVIPERFIDTSVRGHSGTPKLRDGY